MKSFFNFLLISIFFVNSLTAQKNNSKTWPYSFPCRISDSSNPDLMFMTLGDIKTPVAQGMFDPAKDLVTLDNGQTIPSYYKNTLGIKFFEPIDKKIFPLPVSGWCSWYYYYQEVTEGEIMQNAKWLGEHLKEYGAAYVQLDDGWQGTGHGLGENRDWTTINNRFSGGMDKLAAYIKAQGLIPGLWLAPHGQSNAGVVKKNPGVFLLKSDSTSAAPSWEGTYLVDPSSQQTQDYLKSLFKTLSGWGYEYFKIDGQPTVIKEMKNKKSFMKEPSADVDELYRNTLRSIRDGIGPNRFLLGCWVIPTEGIGIMNGSRTGGDVILDWRGFKTALRATMDYYYLHNIAWYNDPDVLLVRNPLPINQAQVWATLQGLSGQSLLTSDRMMDLPAERLELVKRVYPAVDIRPLDLFPAQKNKRIWDLKINHLNRNYDVVGLFNFETSSSAPVYVSWKDLGINDDIPVHVYDFWNREYIGAYENGIAIDIPQTSCRVFSLFPDNGKIQLVSSSRHITQGWVDLTEQSFNEKTNVYYGASNIISNDPYELRFAFPKGKNFRIKSANARTNEGKLEVKVMNHQGWATAEMVSSKTTKVEWEIAFEPCEMYGMPTSAPGDLWVERVGFDGVNIHWGQKAQTSIGWQVYSNGKNLGYTPSVIFPVRNLEPDSTYRFEVRTVCTDFSVNSKKTEIEVKLRPMLPKDLYISELQLSRDGKGWRLPEKDRTILGKAMKMGGKYYYKGLGVPTGSEVEFELKGYFSTFSSLVGIDDENSKDGEAQFIVIGDGKELWNSGIMTKKDQPRQINVKIKGVQKLVLKVIRGSKGASGDQTNWADAKVSIN